MAYVGWARKHVARANQQVRGIIIGGKPDRSCNNVLLPQCAIGGAAGRSIGVTDPSRRGLAVVLCALVILGAWLRVNWINQVASRTGDERTYTDFARRVAARGLGEFRALITEHHQNRDLWIMPPPTRLGEIALVAGWMKVTGVQDERAGTWVSCLSSIASLALLAVIAFRFLPPSAGVYATACLAISLPALVIASRSWADAPMELAGLLMLWGCCELRRGRRQLWKYLLLMTTGSASVLFKETGALIYLGCGLYVVILLLRDHAWREATSFVLCGLAAAAVVSGLLFVAAGGFSSFLTVGRDWSQGKLVNSYDAHLQDGPWLAFFVGWWILTPVNFLLAATGLTLLPVRKESPVGRLMGFPLLSHVRLIYWIALVVLSTVLILPASLNFRYLSPIYDGMYLVGGVGLCIVLGWAGGISSWGGRVTFLLSLACVLAVGVRDYRFASAARAGTRIPDLALGFVLGGCPELR